MISGNEDAGGGPVRYRDAKRYWWLLVPALFIAPAAGGIGFIVTGNPAWVLVPLIYVFVFIPLMDALLGEDPSNPAAAAIPAMTADRYYRRLTWAVIPLHYGLFVGAAWLVAPSMSGGGEAMPWWAVLAVTVGIGTFNGGAITLGHELGHKPDRTSRWMAKLALGVVGYGHFCIEHNRGHHVKVATPEDCSSARMGESVHAFAVRDIAGALKGAISQ